MIEDRTLARPEGDAPARLTDAELAALEALWEAPAREPPRRRVVNAPRWTSWPLGKALALGWIALLVLIEAFAPSTNPQAEPRTWAVVAFVGWLVALPLAALIGSRGERAAGFGLATLAGVLGIVVAASCKATEHHLGNWWLYELAGAASLTAFAAVGLWAERRRSRA